MAPQDPSLAVKVIDTSMSKSNDTPSVSNDQETNGSKTKKANRRKASELKKTSIDDWGYPGHLDESQTLALVSREFLCPC